NSCNECCVWQCQISTIVTESFPMVVTLPGPILSSCPQNYVVGSSSSILSSDRMPISSRAFPDATVT
ncbi:KRF1 protein, partial [Grallaria varia]|nr:KRF1 protein [Grallaria varia]